MVGGWPVTFYTTRSRSWIRDYREQIQIVAGWRFFSSNSSCLNRLGQELVKHSAFCLANWKGCLHKKEFPMKPAKGVEKRKLYSLLQASRSSWETWTKSCSFGLLGFHLHRLRESCKKGNWVGLQGWFAGSPPDWIVRRDQAKFSTLVLAASYPTPWSQMHSQSTSVSSS